MHIGVWQEASEEHERRQAKKRAAASVYGGKGMAKPDYTTKLKNPDIYGGTKQKKPNYTVLINDRKAFQDTNDTR